MLNKGVELDLDAFTPSDYALKGYGLKFNDYAPAAIEASLKSYFETYFSINGAKIEYVNPAYCIGKHVKMTAKYDQRNKEQALVRAYCDAQGWDDGKYMT